MQNKAYHCEISKQWGQEEDLKHIQMMKASHIHSKASHTYTHNNINIDDCSEQNDTIKRLRIWEA